MCVKIYEKIRKHDIVITFFVSASYSLFSPYTFSPIFCHINKEIIMINVFCSIKQHYIFPKTNYKGRKGKDEKKTLASSLIILREIPHIFL